MVQTVSSSAATRPPWTASARRTSTGGATSRAPASSSATPAVASGSGGFSPEGYRSTDDYYDTLDAFLFYWPEELAAPAESTEASPPQPVVLPKVGGSSAALFAYSRGGPQFGADGLLIGPPVTAVMGEFTGPDSSAGVGDLRSARSRLGLSYARRPDGKESLFGDEGRAQLVEVLVFCNPQIASLY
ncbi:unnamed protein product [Miscanthus lutarioriparius]|uniref:Uncharacterized protein n=1 Tax=Miscanthus lutarioriparius TaxID=422564 RepID=A0A811QMS3_9POAL|nr:unnamed protein product [Miscanthus lutarioriparius]